MKTSSIIFGLAVLFVAGCKTPPSISGYYNYETQCLGKSHSGTQTVKTWGTGKNLREAQTHAYQEALQDILFQGIRNGNPDCDLMPLVSEANARVKYENYFNYFFSEKGNYRDFIFLSEDRSGFKKNSDSNLKRAYAYIIEIDVPALKQQLKIDDIIP